MKHIPVPGQIMDDIEMEEHDIRRWFVMNELEQARDTLRVCEGIIQARLEAQPKRKQRSDAGKRRTNGEDEINADARLFDRDNRGPAE